MSEQEFNLLFSKNLNNYLSLNGKTQLDLANHLGVSPSSVSAWCRGVKIPRMDKVDAMCRYFGIKRSNLMQENTSRQGDDFLLNELEKDIIRKFRLLTDGERSMFLRAIGIEEKRDNAKMA